MGIRLQQYNRSQIYSLVWIHTGVTGFRRKITGMHQHKTVGEEKREKEREREGGREGGREGEREVTCTIFTHQSNTPNKLA